LFLLARFFVFFPTDYVLCWGFEELGKFAVIWGEKMEILA